MKRISVLALALLAALPLAAQTRTALAVDTFVRSNAANLGANWVNFNQTAGTIPQIVSNLVEPGAAGGSSNVAVWAAFPDLPYDQFSSITIKAKVSATDVASAGVRIQQSGGGTINATYAFGGYYCGGLTSSTTYQIWRVGSATGVGDNSVNSLQNTAVTITVNDTVILQAQGSTLTCFVNGTQIAQVTDTNFPGGLAGFFIAANAAVANSAFNNFTAGAVSTAPTINTPAPVSVATGLPTPLGTLTGTGQALELITPPISRNYLGRLQIVADGVVANPTWVLECTQTGGATWFQLPASTVPSMAPQLGDIPDTFAPFYDVSGLGGARCRFGLSAGTVTGTLTVNAQAN